MCSFLCLSHWSKRGSWKRIGNSRGWDAECNKCPSSRQAVAIQPLLHKHPSLQPHLSVGRSGAQARFVVSVSEHLLKNVITRTDRRFVACLDVQAHFRIWCWHCSVHTDKPSSTAGIKKNPNDNCLLLHAEGAKDPGGSKITGSE